MTVAAPSNVALDSHARDLLREQEYFTRGQYRERSGLPESTTRHHLRRWCQADLLVLHGAGRARHYTLPGSPSMLGREARWRLVAAPLLEQHGWIVPADYRAAVEARYQGIDPSGLHRDLTEWVRQGRLQAVGQANNRVYLPPDVEPREWASEPDAPPGTRLDRWAIARQIAERGGRLTIPLLAERTQVSESTAGRDLAAWVERGWLERSGTGTHITWHLPGQGPGEEYAPERAERVERLAGMLAERGASTAEDGARFNHSAVPIARRDLNALVLAGKAVRVRVLGGQQMVWVALPLPEAITRARWAKEAMTLAQREGSHEGREELLERWRWGTLVEVLPATAEEAAKVWSIGRPTASQRLAVLEAAGLVRRTSGGRRRPDRFALAA